MLISNQIYHIYNRSNNKEIIFKQERNYDYFYTLLEKYLFDSVELLGYSLMPTHFHLVVKIRAIGEILEKVKVPRYAAKLPPVDQVHAAVTEQFGKMFITYAMAINVQEKRHGSLFQKNFKHKLVDTVNYFCTVMAYIHYNPIEANLVDNFSDYLYSSYYLIKKTSKNYWINIEEVRKQFGGRKAFEEFHRIYKKTRALPTMAAL